MFVFVLNGTLVKDLELNLDFSRFRGEGSRGSIWCIGKWNEHSGRKVLGGADQDEAMCGDTGISHSRGALSSACGCFILPNFTQKKMPLWPPYSPSTIPNLAALGTGVPRPGPWDSGSQEGLCHYKPAGRQVIGEMNIHLQDVFY